MTAIQAFSWNELAVDACSTSTTIDEGGTPCPSRLIFWEHSIGVIMPDGQSLNHATGGLGEVFVECAENT